MGNHSVPWGILWACRPYECHYLPYNFTGPCSWGKTYTLGGMIDTHIYPRIGTHFRHTTMLDKQTGCHICAPCWNNSQAYCHNHFSKLYCFNFNHTRNAVSLVSDKVSQIRKVVLQTWMALDLLTVAHGGTSAILHTECCVYTPYNSHMCLRPWPH